MADFWMIQMMMTVAMLNLVRRVRMTWERDQDLKNYWWLALQRKVSEKADSGATVAIYTFDTLEKIDDILHT